MCSSDLVPRARGGHHHAEHREEYPHRNRICIFHARVANRPPVPLQSASPVPAALPPPLLYADTERSADALYFGKVDAADLVASLSSACVRENADRTIFLQQQDQQYDGHQTVPDHGPAGNG